MELAKMDHDREIQILNKKLEQKNEELDKQLEDFVMNKLDLDEYNLTSDDFRASEESKSVKNKGSRNHAFDERKAKKQNVTKARPGVPKLDLTKIFEWREKSNNDNIIMIRISDSRITGEDRITEEINDEDGIQRQHKRYFANGSHRTSTSQRVTDLFERKQMIINALNQAYADEDEDTITSPRPAEAEE